jgi:hypothetical protein
MASSKEKPKPKTQHGGHGSQRLQRETAFLAALLTSASVTQAADQAGVPLRTARRWYSESRFRERLLQEQNAVIEHNLMRLKTTTGTALDVLSAIMVNAGAPSGSRVLAAKTLLDNAFKAIEVSDIMERLAKLEEKINGGEWM